MHNSESALKNEKQKRHYDFVIQMDHQVSVKGPDLIIIIIKKKRTCSIVNFAVSVDYKVKLKEWEKRDKYLDLPRELKKLRNMKVKIIPVVIGALGSVTKRL